MNWLEHITKQSQFVHEGNIPKDFAMAVYKILHNQADFPEWELIDKFRAENQPVLEWISSILKSNGIQSPELEQELHWWQQQISQPSDN